MKILNWNVNGIRVRLDQIQELITQYDPDIITLQEVKKKIDYQNDEESKSILDSLCMNGKYQYIHNSHSHHAGILTLFKPKLKDSHRVMYENRISYLEFDNLVLFNVYIESGKGINHPSVTVDKVDQMEHLIKYSSLHKDKNLIIVGDFNICPKQYHVWSVDHWPIYKVVSRTRLEIELFEELEEESGLENIETDQELNMTWYGYRHAWRKLPENPITTDYGIKCDHVLSNIPNTKLEILNEWRFNKIELEDGFEWKKTSDHVPMLIVIEDL